MSCRADKTNPGVRFTMLLLAGLLAPLRAERVAVAQSRSQPALPTFPSEVELITVDAVVLDDKGRPVPGLTRDDFVVKEDGRIQEIASFEAFVLEPAEAPTAPPAVASNDPASRSGNSRAFAILVDDVRIAPERTEVVRGAVSTFLERSIRDGDLLTLRTSSGDVSWTARVPEGVEDLVAVLSRVKGRAAAPQSIDRMSEYEAFRITNREDAPTMSGRGPSFPTSVAGGAATPPGEDPPVPGTGLGSTKERVKKRWQDALLCTPINCDRLVRARAMELDAHRRARMRVTFDAVRRELGALALDHGRKSLLLLSDGFVEDYSSDLREVAAASREANTAIYFLDVRGLVAQPGFGSASEVATFSLPDPREQSAMGFEDTALASAGAQTLADVTGGFSVRNTNDLAGGMERIARESRVFYLLGFHAPPGKSAGQWRKLSVEVNKPGLTVRARRGYTLQTKAEPRADKKGKPKAGPDPIVARALDAASEASGIPLRAMAYVLEPRPKDTVHVLVAAELDASRLALQPAQGAQVARVEVSVVAMNRDSGRGFRHDDKVELRLQPGERPGWRALVREFELPAGVTQVRVVVRDATSGATGSVSQRFEVPLPGPLRLSTPILTERVEPAADAEALPQVALAVHRVFPAGGGLYVQFEVFGAARDHARGAPRVTAGLEIWSGGGRLARKMEPTAIAVDPSGRLVRQVGISLEGMGEGPYDLVLDVHDEVSGARLKHRESFALARDVASR
jgi:VWFA-related protein